MHGNRKAAETELISCIEAILPGSENTKIYQDIFKGMPDKEFDQWILDLESGARQLALIVPELGSITLDVERNLDVAEKWGHNFFESIWMDPQNGSPAYLSNDKYLIVDLPLKRQAQFLIKKISIPEDNRSIDTFTGQPTGKSKGSKISWPELQILAALGGFDETIAEFFKFRGGDLQGFNAMNNMIANTGGVSLNAVGALGTKVKAVQSLSTLLTAMHISNSGI
ncbi:putative virion structural protein [Ralstonia phage RP12]|uniref:Putative virion structural protein n=1 Tax=Ralstonia phage RP12 TaxID=1923889 RepID=A0A1L7N0N5_9CAUD|nr:RNA polymerase beta subunit [Ralstonia phage RP12]BAW19029.1 putative virion structural protein [Ralstonia phage RP12]